MLFNKLVDKLSPFLLDEKYHSYSIPTKKTAEWGGNNEMQPAETNKYLMYDFYVLDYLNFLVGSMPPKQFRDLNPDMEASVKDAVKKLMPYLREELLNSVFYAICAEIRNTTSHLSNYTSLLPEGSKERRLYMDWLKYMRIHRKNGSDKSYSDVDLEIFGSDKPSSEVRTPELEKDNSQDRNLSYKAANYSIKKNGATRKDFIDMATTMFYEGKWSSSYGGPAWGRIGKGWTSLFLSNNLTPRTKQAIDSPVKPMSVAIDHVYDLQHNTDTVFNKLKSYYSPKSGYNWLKTALDHKANVKSYHDLLQHVSGSVKAMALPVLYNRLGTTWEQNIRDNRPDDLYDHAREEQKNKDAEHEAQIQANIKLVQNKSVQSQQDSTKLKSGFNDGDNELNQYNVHVGSMVICVNDAGYDDLTIEKEYKVVETNLKTLTIIDDSGQVSNYYYKRFKKKEVPAIESTSLHTGKEIESYENVTSDNSKVGDKIVCWNDKGNEQYLTMGKEYAIIKMNNSLVRVIDDEDISSQYNIDRFKKLPQDTGEYTVEDWNSGDTLKCINNKQGALEELELGQLYSLLSTPTQSKSGWFVSIKDSSGESIGVYRADRFENITLSKKGAKSALASLTAKIAQKSKSEDVDSSKAIEDKYEFKVGDLVKHKHTGMMGKVTEFFDYHGRDGISVVDDEGDKCMWKAVNAEKIIKKERPKTASGKIDMKFQNGETVKCVSGSGNFGLTIGNIYKINSSYPEGGRYYVMIVNDYGTKDSYFADRFIKVDDNPDSPKGKKLRSFKDKIQDNMSDNNLQVGDDVEYTDPLNGIVYKGILSHINIPNNTHYPPQGYVKFPEQNGSGPFSKWTYLKDIRKDLKI